MVKLLKQIERLIRGGTCIAFAVMILAVVVQVVARTFMSQPPIWTEETSRVALLYIMGLGVGASFLTGDLVNVDLALMVMPPWLRRACEIFSAALVSAFGFLLVPGAWEFTVSGTMQTSPVLHVQMQYVFACVLFFSVLLGVFGLIKFIRLVFNAAVAEPSGHASIKG